MKVYDCCLFYNEPELLELRLHTHKSWAHAHVVVESPRTFSNLPKPIRLDAEAPAFRPFAATLRHIVADDLPWPEAKGRELGKEGRMALNRAQWEEARRGLGDAKPEDIIVLCDLDELLRPEAIEEAKRIVPEKGRVRFGLEMYWYWLNGRRSGGWHGPVAGLARDLLKAGASLWEFRQALRNQTSEPNIANAGWHFAYQGGLDAVRLKLESAAHNEYDRFLDDRAALAKWIADGHPFAPNNDPPGQVRCVPLDQTFPAYLLAHRDRFKHMIRVPQ